MQNDQADSMLLDAKIAHNKGDFKRAVGLLADLVRSEQDHPEANYLLGSCYLASGYPAEAIQHFKIANQAAPPHAPWLMDMITALRLHGASDEALETGRQLLQMVPSQALAHVCYANLLADTGRSDEAADTFRTAIRLDRHCAEAWLGLAQLGDDHAAGISTEELQQLSSQTLPFDPGLDPVQMRRQSMLSSCVARLRHLRQEYAAAFTHFTTANRYRKQLQRRHNSFSIDLERQQFERMCAACQTDFPVAPQQRRSDGQFTPIFIVGMLRTGTTLLETLLCRHSQIAGGGEMMHMKHIAKDKLPRATGVSYPQLLNQLTPELSRMAAQHYIELASATALRMNPDLDVKATRYIVDKMPSNHQDLALIRKLFPDAIVIHTSRDPMDTLWSCYREELSASYSNDLDDLLDYYLLYRDYMSLWQQCDLDIHHLTYEDLVTDPDSSVHRLLHRCGLTTEDIVSNQSRASLTNTASAQQVRKPIHNKAIGQWRLYAEQLQSLQARLKTLSDADQAADH